MCIPSEGFGLFHGLLKRVKDGHGVRNLSVQGESLPAVTEVVEAFRDSLLRIMEEKGLTLLRVFNCDETGLYWRLVPNKTRMSSKEKEA